MSKQRCSGSVLPLPRRLPLPITGAILPSKSDRCKNPPFPGVFIAVVGRWLFPVDMTCRFVFNERDRHWDWPRVCRLCSKHWDELEQVVEFFGGELIHKEPGERWRGQLIKD